MEISSLNEKKIWKYAIIITIKYISKVIFHRRERFKMGMESEKKDQQHTNVKRRKTIKDFYVLVEIRHIFVKKLKTQFNCYSFDSI